MVGFKGEQLGQLPQGLHKTEVEPTDFIEKFYDSIFT
jgi:hypothetical protein